MLFCLGFGSYKLISNLLDKNKTAPPQVASGKSPEAVTPEAVTPVAVATIDAADTPIESAKPPAATRAPIPKPPETPKTSLQELYRLYKVEGIAHGSRGSMVMINQTPLHEGETLDGLTIEKIQQDHIDVVYQQHKYQLRAKVF